MKPSEIKRIHEALRGERGHFFTRSSMKFFGDTMKSFGSKTIDGQVFLYRRPSAQVNVFGDWKTAGTQFSNVWKFDPETGDLSSLPDPEKTEWLNKYL